MPNVTSSLIGVNLTRVDSTALFPVGTLVNLSDGGQAMYVKASTSALSTFAAVSIDAAGIATMLTTTNAPNSPRIGFAQTSVATSAYGWVQLGGKVSVNLAAQCDDAVPLFSTATAGVLDDATVTLGYVAGLTSTTTISNATAVTCIGAYPHIQRYGGGA
jgi:hypothetical protein